MVSTTVVPIIEIVNDPGKYSDVDPSPIPNVVPANVRTVAAPVTGTADGRINDFQFVVLDGVIPSVLSTMHS